MNIIRVLSLLSLSSILFFASCKSTPKLPPIPDFPCAFTESSHVTAHNGKAHLSKLIRPLFSDDFHNRAEHWAEMHNSDNRLLFTYGERDGMSGLILSKDPKVPGTDTAFELKSHPFKVISGSAYTFSILAAGTVDMIIASPYGDLYHNCIEWLDKDGTLLSTTPFKYTTRRFELLESKISGIIPANATQAVIRIGADKPNIPESPKDFVLLSKVDFQSEDSTSDVFSSGAFISRPFYKPGPGMLSWDAELPLQTSVTFQIATAQDNHGVPGEWSAFVGPGNNPLHHFTTSGQALPAFSEQRPWICYKAFFTGLNEHTPQLKSVTIGSVTDGNWVGPDRTAPRLSLESPVRPLDPAAPVRFRLSDDTAIDWSSLKITLDGRDITNQTVRDGHSLTYTPKNPFQTFVPSFENLKTWRLEKNTDMAIAFQDLKNHPNGLRFARHGKATRIEAQLKSPELIVTPGKHLTFKIDVRGTAENDGSPDILPIRICWSNSRGFTLSQSVPVPSVNSSRAWKTYTLTTDVPLDARKAFAVVTLSQDNLPRGTYIEIANPHLSGNGWKPQPHRPRNVHKFTLSVSDLFKHVTTADFRIIVPDSTLPASRVTIREDGAVLVDGTPFFPIGMYAVWKRDHNGFDFDRAFAELSEAGFNVAHAYDAARNDDYKEFMDTAHRHGIKLFIPGGKGVNSPDIDEFISDILTDMAHPAVLAWYLSDDTASWCKPPQLSAINQAVHEADPTRITLQADTLGDGRVSRYHGFADATDGFLPELYPVTATRAPDKTVPMIIHDMKSIKAEIAASGKSVKTIWPIIQYFKGWGAWTRFPTFAELRAMSYESIIHGGNGITFYTYLKQRNDNYGVLTTPETWKNMKTIASEMKQLSPVFLSENTRTGHTVQITDGPSKDAMGYDSISVLHKQLGSKHYLICANSAFEPVTVSLSLPGTSSCTVLFEDRTLGMSRGKLEDTFEPYGVHVYELR